MRKIKSKKEFLHTQNGKVLINHTSYNELGDVILLEEYDFDRKLTLNVVCEYNKQNLLSKELISYDQEREETVSYKYNEQKELVEIVKEFKGGEQLIFEYKRVGNAIEIIQKTDDDEVEIKQLANYDEQGNLISEVDFDAEGNWLNKYEWVYDDQNRQIVELAFENEHEVASSFETHYDFEGRVVRQIYKDDITHDIWEYEYEKPSDDTAITRKYFIDFAVLKESGLDESEIRELDEEVITKYNEDKLPLERVAYEAIVTNPLSYEGNHEKISFEYSYWEG